MTSPRTTKDRTLVEVLPGKIVELKGRYAQIGDYVPYELQEPNTAEEASNYGKGYGAGWLGIPGTLNELGKSAWDAVTHFPRKIPEVGGFLNYVDAKASQYAPATEEKAGEAMGADTQSKEFIAGTYGLPGLEDAAVAGSKGLAAILLHGSPRKWHGPPSLNFIGTGEGSQHFGPGLYLAENPNVSGTYRDVLSQVPVIGRGNVSNKAQNYVSEMWPEGDVLDDNWLAGMKEGARRDSVVGKTIIQSKDAKAPPHWMEGTPQEAYPGMWWIADKDTHGGLTGPYKTKTEAMEGLKRRYLTKQELEEIESLNLEDIYESEGYEYAMDVDDDVIPLMIDFHKPLHKQKPHIKDGMRRMFARRGIDFDEWAKETGGEWMDAYQNVFETTSERELAMELASEGIPGMRFLDSGSRPAALTGRGGFLKDLKDLRKQKETRNMIVFDESIVKRVERDGKLTYGRYEGEAYRAPGFNNGPPKGATAADVIREEISRGNIPEDFPEDVLKDYESVPATELRWVGRSREGLMREYGPDEISGYEGMIQDPDDIEDVSTEMFGGRILAEDPDVGVLVHVPKGQKQRVYHGGPGSKEPALNDPAFVTTEREGAQWFADERGGAVRAFDMTTNNPLDLDTREGMQRFFAAARRAGAKFDVKGDIMDKNKAWDFDGSASIPLFSPYDGTNPVDLLYVPGVRDQLEKMGYDSVRLSDTLGNSSIDTFVPTRAKNLRPVEGGSVLQSVGATLKEDPTKLGFKVIKSSGKIVGAPPGVQSADDILPLAEAYAARVERALDAGLDPDWFYREGEKAIKRISPDAPTAVQMGEVNAITSSEAPVRSNFGWAVQPYEQAAAGYPISTGKYPKEASEKIGKVMAGDDPHLGEKRHLYGQGLSGVGREMPQELRRAPNDRWEIRSFGYNKDSAGPAQHNFMHQVRAIATDIVNERRGTNFDAYNAQELNWAVQRADDMNISIMESAKDNIQESIPHYTFQHSWETQPGYYDPELKDRPLIDVDMPSHDKALQDIYYENPDRDELVDIFGGKFQEAPLKNVPGVFEGEVTPYGQQSRSLVYHTQADGLSQPSRDRVQATEMTRSYFNLQNAGAGSLEQASKRKTVKPFGGTMGYGLGRPINQEETQAIMDTLSKYYNVSKDIGVVPTEKGFRILSTGAKGLEKHAGEIEDIVGAEARIGDFENTSFYDELPWKERRATEVMLENLTPKMREHADSDSMRLLAGKLYDYYKGLEARPPEGFRRVLRAWATGGISAVEALVKSGVAPAGVLGILIGQQLMQGENPQQSRGT